MQTEDKTPLKFPSMKSNRSEVGGGRKLPKTNSTKRHPENWFLSHWLCDFSWNTHIHPVCPLSSWRQSVPTVVNCSYFFSNVTTYVFYSCLWFSAQRKHKQKVSSGVEFAEGGRRGAFWGQDRAGTLDWIDEGPWCYQPCLEARWIKINYPGLGINHQERADRSRER